MKNIFIIFTFLLTTLLHATIDERKSDVYFANGVDTTEKQAEKARDKLFDETELNFPNAFSSIVDWKVSYNETHGFQQDIYESAIQKVFTQLDDKHSGYHYGGATVWIIDTVMKFPALKDLLKGTLYYGGRTFVKDQLKDHLINETKNALVKRGLILSKEDILFLADVVFDELLDNLLANPLDDTLDDINKDVLTQATAYANSIKQGHGVIVVAHSQGNFFTNFTVEKKMQQWAKQYFHVIGVATPTSSIANGGPHLTFHNDVIQAVPGHLGWNVTNPTPYYRINAAQERVETFVSVEAHNFLSSYMATSATKNAILGFIDDAVLTHNSTPSQWIKDKETGCGCDKRITLKHISSSATMNALVEDKTFYGFNEATGKVYSIDGEYVKASPAGTSIQDLTADLETNGGICYTLDGTSDEPIVGYPKVSPKEGVVEVFLDWQTSSIDLDLNLVNWEDVGEYDIKDTGCPSEHFVIEDALSVKEGHYFVEVGLKDAGGVDSNISEDVTLVVSALGNSKPFNINITEVSKLNIGKVAEIIIKYENNEPVITISPDPVFINKPSVTVGESVSGTSRSCSDTLSSYHSLFRTSISRTIKWCRCGTSYSFRV